MPSNPTGSDIPEEARTLAEPDALAALRDDPVLANVRTFESFPVLGSCVLFSRLGGGAQGAVYRAWHRELNIQVAVKARLASAGIAADRFVFEAAQGAGLTHHNLIGALEVKEADGLQYMILDYVDGEDVAARLRRKRRLDAREALTILREAAVGLAFAHKKGVLHRDIKPANIMISKDGEVKIADLGLAKASHATDLSLTQEGSGMGTPMFMPPEQFLEAKSVGPAADVYSLAITGWMMLAGTNPFKGSSPYEIKDDVCDRGVANLMEVVPDVAPSIADLIARATERQASKRIPDGTQFLAGIERELYALGGPVDLADPQAGASLHLGVQPPSRDVITRLIEHESLERQRSRNEHATIMSGPRQETPVVPPREDSTTQKKKSPAAALFVLLLAAGGGAGWWFTMGPGSASRGLPKKGAPTDFDSDSARVNASTKGASTAKDAGEVQGEPPTPVLPTKAPGADHAALARAALASRDWSTMFQEMDRHVESSTEDDEALRAWVDTYTQAFRKKDGWKQTRDRLNEAGAAAVAALAENPRSDTPWTCLTAAELSVSYDGIRYRVVDGPGDHVAFLGKCAFGTAEVQTEATFLEGLTALDEFLIESAGNQIPTRETTNKAYELLKQADADDHGSAGAWIGVLYLRILEIEKAKGHLENVPRNWSLVESALVESLENGAPSGSKEAHYVLASMYGLGMAGSEMPAKERREIENEHYVQAAKLGHPEAITILMERGVNIGTAVNDNLEELESFRNQPNPRTRARVERLLSMAVLTDQHGVKVAARSKKSAADGLLELCMQPIAPDASDFAWLDRSLWLLWAEGTKTLSLAEQESWFEEACASPLSGTYRPLAMYLLVDRHEPLRPRAVEIFNTADMGGDLPNEEALVSQLRDIIDSLRDGGRFLPLVEGLLPAR